MAITFTDEQVDLLYNKGFTDEDLEYTINEDRKNGLKDEEIQRNILNAIGVETKPKFNPFKATPEEFNEEYKRQGQEKLDKRIEWEEKHPFLSRLQADYQPFYRSDRSAMERQAKYGYNEPIGEALKNTGKEIGLAAVPYINTGRDAYLTTLTGGGSLLGRIGLGIGTGALQGASSEALDELSNNGLSKEVLNRGLQGGALGGATGGIISGGIEGVNAARGGIKNIIENPNFQNSVTKSLEGLTSVPQKYSQRALEAELSGNSILKGKFDKDAAYRPIEEKLTQAKNLLPSAEDYADSFDNLGQKVKTNIENLKEAAGQEISDMLGKLKAEPIDIRGLKNSLNSLVKGYARGGDINPATVRASHDIDMVKELLGIKSDEQITKELSDYFTNNRLAKEDWMGKLTPADKEAQNVAFSILSRATGKDKNWLKSQLNAQMPKMSTQKRQEFIEKLLENTDDKIETNTIDPSWYEHFPELYGVGEQYGISGRELAQKAYDRIMRKDYTNTIANYENAQNQLYENLAKQYDNILYKLTKNPNQQGIDNAFVEFDKAFGDLDQNIKEQYINKLAQDIESIQNMGKSLIKPIDLHNAKEILYDIANYNTADSGIKNDVLKGMVNQINNYLRNKFPQYIKPNDKYAMIKKLEYNLGGTNGINSNTIGGKLSNYGSASNIESGLDRRLRDINNILPLNQQFINDTKNLVNSRNKINEINSAISQKYLDNPRPLADKNSIRFENAIQDLQNTTGVNFIDDLNNVRAREALEALSPGQGGGYGSSQGSMNKIRGGITTALAGLGGVSGGIPGAIAAPLLGMAMFSPKIMAQGTIKNLGKLYQRAGQQVPEAVQRLLNPLAVRMTTPMLYGQISNTEEDY